MPFSLRERVAPVKLHRRTPFQWKILMRGLRLEVDADVNDAWNIAKRAHGLLLHETGGLFDSSRNSSHV
jgi:hypothetical protein